MENDCPMIKSTKLYMSHGQIENLRLEVANLHQLVSLQFIFLSIFTLLVCIVYISLRFVDKVYKYYQAHLLMSLLHCT